MSLIHGVKHYAERCGKVKMAWLVSVFDDASCTYSYYHNPVYIRVYLLLSGMLHMKVV